MTRVIAALLGFLVCFGLSLSVSSHVPPVQEIPKQEVLQYEVSVTLKLIQVYVTDKNGTPVLDLKNEDFVVRDNGKPVTITDFEKHDLLSPAAERVVPAQPPARTINRKFILFFDFAFNNHRGIGASIQAALHFLDSQVLPGDEVAVLSFSMLKGLRVHEFLTLDHGKAREAVAALAVKDIAGRADDVEYEYMQMVELAPFNSGNKDFDAQLFRVEGDRKGSGYQAQDYVQALTTLAKALRLVDGRKNFLFFSTGTPYSLIHGESASGFRPGDPYSLRKDTTYGETPQFQLPNSVLQPLYEAMLKEFNASNCAFYAFDTRESAKVTHLFSYDEMAFDIRVTGVRSSGAGTNVTNPFQDEKTTGMNTLKQISKETGGQYFSNIGLYDKNMDQVQNITGAYYVLGYPISSAVDGKFHNVHVDVKRKDCQVRTQTGYFNPKPFRDFTKLERELQLYDLALNERSEFQTPNKIPTTALSYDAGEGVRLRTVSRISRETLKAIAGKNVELVTLLFDDKDNVSSLQRTAADLTLYSGKDLVFSAGVAVRPGSYKCRLIVRNLDTGESAVGAAAAFVGKPASSGLTVFPPLLLTEEGNLLHVEGFVKGKLDRLSWRDVYPYDAARYSPMSGAEAERMGKIVAVVPFSAAGAGQPEVTFSVRLIDSAAGAQAPLSMNLLSRFRASNVHVQTLELDLGQVPPGDYTLYFYAVDGVTGSLGNAHIPLTIRR